MEMVIVPAGEVADIVPSAGEDQLQTRLVHETIQLLRVKGDHDLPHPSICVIWTLSDQRSASVEDINVRRCTDTGAQTSRGLRASSFS
jgi:hypothetical protein